MKELKNFGTMTSKELKNLLNSLPSDAKIEKSDLMRKVTHPNGTVMLSAARIDAYNWHIRALPKLIITTEVKP